jgi:hypothetical protein
VGKLIGYGLSGGTVGSLVAGYVGTATMGGAATMVWIFGTRIVNTGMDTASSAPVGEVVYHLSTGLQATLGFLGVRLLQDPVFYVALALMLVMSPSVRGRTRSASVA